MPPARRSSPVSRAHDAHFQGRRCHGQAEMQQPSACLSRGPLAYARSALYPQRLPRASPLPPFRQWLRPPPTGSPRPQRTAWEDPPRHSREPLRTPGPGCSPGSSRPAPAQGMPGLVVRTLCRLALRCTAPPTAPRAAAGSCAGTCARSAAGFRSTLWAEQA